MEKKQYFGMTQCLSDSKKLICCIVQYGTGNTIETSKLKDEWFPYSQLKDVIKSKITPDLYVEQVEFVKITMTTEKGKKTKYEFELIPETEELNELFKVPDYFAGEDWSFLH